MFAVEKMPAVLIIAILLACLATSDFSDDQKVTGHVGKNVTLEFSLTSSRIGSISLTRQNSSKYVFYCRDGHWTDRRDQDPQFIDRVVTRSCQPEDKTFPLTLLNVTKNDSGTYTWRIKYREGNESSLNVFLIVTDGEHQGALLGGKEVAAVGIAVGIAVLIVVVIVVKWRRMDCPLSSIKGFFTRENPPVGPPPEPPVGYRHVSGSEETV